MKANIERVHKDVKIELVHVTDYQADPTGATTFAVVVLQMDTATVKLPWAIIERIVAMNGQALPEKVSGTHEYMDKVFAIVDAAQHWHLFSPSAANAPPLSFDAVQDLHTAVQAINDHERENGG